MDNAQSEQLQEQEECFTVGRDLIHQTLREDIEIGCSTGYLLLLRFNSEACFFLAETEKLIIQKLDGQVLNHDCVHTPHQKLSEDQDQR